MKDLVKKVPGRSITITERPAGEPRWLTDQPADPGVVRLQGRTLLLVRVAEGVMQKEGLLFFRR